MVGYEQALVGKKRLIFQFVDGQKRVMSASLLLYLREKEYAGQEVDEPIYDLPKIGKI